MSNQGSADLGLSKITKKSQIVEEEKKDNEKSLQKIEDKLAKSQDLRKSSIGRMANAAVDSEALRKKYLMDKIGGTVLKLVKKSKKLGSNKIRDIVLDENDVLRFKQTKDKGKKSFEAPNTFIPQTRAEFLEMSQRPQSDRDLDRCLAWNMKEIQELDFRLIFKRREAAKVAETAFYFKDEEQFIKVTNYFKCLVMLEKTDGKLSESQVAIKSIMKRFDATQVAKVRALIKKKADDLRKNKNNNKDLAIKNALNITKLQGVVVGSLLSKWRESARLAGSNKERKNFVVENSTILNHLDAFLLQSLTYAWKQAAEAKVEPNKENILLEFGSLELSVEIPQPTIEVIVNTNKSYPEDLTVNSVKYADKTFNQLGGCRVIEQKVKLIKNEKGEEQEVGFNTWSLYSRQSAMGESDASLDDFAFSLGIEQSLKLEINSYQKSYLDATEITINLNNDEGKKVCYTTVSLKYLYEASKKGQDIWLWLRPKAGENLRKQAFIHLNVKSSIPDNISRQVSINRNLQENIYDKDMIEDSFYKYSFKMPSITPKHTKFLEILDRDWQILDEKTRGMYSSHEYGKYIQRIKYNLFRRYQVQTSRKLAHLRKNEDVWAIFQSEMAAFATKHEGQEVGKIWLKYSELVKPKTDLLSNGDDARRIDDSDSPVVSYLHKRSQWENKKEWNRFFDKLAKLAFKGFPQASRIDIWSQLGRVSHYLVVTEEVYTKYIGLRSYKEGNPPPRVDDEPNSEENLYFRGEKIYNKLKNDANKETIYLYQELEDDIKFLRESSDKSKLPYENNIRNVMKTYIFWLKLFSESGEEEKYFVNYSRSLLNICLGLTVCQNCSYLASPLVDEYQIFWLLISLTTYILPSYFEASSEKSASSKSEDRRRNNIINSALRCSQMKGIKSDILLLKILLQEKDPQLYQKFEELGVPLDFYFADHMTTLFFNLFNPGMAFRLWDVFFFEGSSENPVRCNSIIVCVIFKLLTDCRAMILKAKKAGDVTFLIELYAKFQTKYSKFIKGVLEIASQNLFQKIPSTETLAGKFEYITYALFSNKYNRLDNKIKMIEHKIESHYKDVHSQNNLIYDLANNTDCVLSDTEKVPFNYNILSRMIRDFRQHFGILHQRMEFRRRVDEDQIKEEFENVNMRKKRGAYNAATSNTTGSDVKLDPARFQHKKISKIAFKIHKLTLYWPEIDQLCVEVVYEREVRTKRKFDSLNLNFEGEFIARKKEIHRYIRVDIYDEKDPENRIRIKSLIIDLKGLPVDSITKQVLKVDESNDLVPNNNNIASEAEISILLVADDIIGDENNKNKAPPTPFIEDLEHNEYKEFRQLNLDRIFKPVQSEANLNPQANGVNGIEVPQPVEEDPLNIASYKYTLLSKNRHAWKQNYALTVEEFEELMKKVAPFWQNVRYRPIFEAMKKVNQNNTFYANDFFTLLTLFSKFTLNQKLSIIFDILANFDDRFDDKSSEVPYYIYKGLADYLYDAFMIYIPYNEIENLVDLSFFGYSSNIKKVVINSVLGEKTELTKASLNRLTNFIHLNYHMKEIHLYHQDILNFIAKIYETEIREGLPSRPVNSIEITYFNNGTSHKIKLDVDSNWRILLDKNDPYNEENHMSILLHKFRYIISMSPAPHILTKDDFISSFQRLPLFNYMVSFENREVKNTLAGLKDFRFIVQMNNENLFIATPDNVSKATKNLLNSLLAGANEENEERKKFYLLLREWDDLILKAGIKPQVGGKTVAQNKKFNKNQSVPSFRVPRHKTDLSLSYDKILQNIKRVVMRDIFSVGNRNISNLNEYNPYLLNENLYNFRGKVALRINESKAIEITNAGESSPFKTLLELLEEYHFNDKLIQTVDFIYTLSEERVPEVEFKHPHQLARYRFADGSTDWWPCQFKLKYQYSGANGKQQTGYGISFDNYPTETVLKRSNDIAIINAIDLDELEYRPLERMSYRPLVNSPAKKQISLGKNDESNKKIAQNIQYDDDDDFEIADTLKIRHNYN